MKTHTCSECGFTAKNAGGLSSHKRRHKNTPAAQPIPMNTSPHTSGAVCTTCHSLPVGSVELVSLLLVVIFSLTAVLLTSTFAIDSQNQDIAMLEAQLQ